MTFALLHEPSGQTIAHLMRADRWWAKGIGVLGRQTLPPGEGIWMPGVSAIHTVFVRFSLDILFLDARLRTIRAAVGVPPGRPLVWARGACHTVEIGAGTLARLASQTKIGDRWEFIPV